MAQLEASLFWLTGWLHINLFFIYLGLNQFTSLFSHESDFSVSVSLEVEVRAAAI